MSKEQIVPNVVNGEEVASSSSRTQDVINPATGEKIATVPLSTAEELSDIIVSAKAAQKSWGAEPLKDRVQVMFKLKHLLETRKDELAELVTLENGKTHPESIGSIMRAVECCEFAASLPQISTSETFEVSKGVTCQVTNQPLGVVAGITPFNFPMMVPLWMVPMAIAAGNAFVLKPSEQTPLSSVKLAELLKESGLPAGVFSVVQGDKEIVEGLCDHEDVKAIGFVGSTPVAKAVYVRGSAAGKRVRALGGAKNHLVVVPDADPEMAASNIVASVAGCAGQRCMAASVLIAVGNVDHILKLIEEKMSAIVPGKDMGPVISKGALERIEGYLARAEEGGATLRLDGRNCVSQGDSKGYYIGASIIDNATPAHESSCDEIFGPVLTIIRCKNLDEAIQMENANPYGNAAAIYTSSGKVARDFTDQAEAGMVGVNIGVPVPREPFPFGGWNLSRFGDGDLTGPGAIGFWSRAKKITTKWSAEGKANWMS
jgi:malonate-semialdehyde dehydrogenase (acetylating)/methylmalonate-semialdehyde dehydrogenase